MLVVSSDANEVEDIDCKVCIVLRRDLSIKRGLGAKKLARE